MNPETLKAQIRATPIQSAGVGLVALYLLRRLPVAGLIGLAVRVAFVLFKPALLVLGGIKAWDLIQARCAENSQARPESRF